MSTSQFCLHVMQLLFSILFVVLLLIGGFLVRNRRRLFGKDPAVPGDNLSARTYNEMQVFAVWAHAVVLSGAFAVGLH